MPFGLCNAQATFQATMNHIFAEYIDDFVVVYIDDLLVYSKMLEEHEEHLRKVLSKMDEHQLRARIPKCRFLQPTVEYLGYIVGHGTIAPNEKKTRAIRNWPTPRDTHDLRSFLGMANTLLRFVPMYADISSSLTDLLKGSPAKTAPLQWSSQH